MEVSANQAAQKTGVHLATIVKHIGKGALPARKRLNQYRIKLSDLEKWASSQGLTVN